MSSEPAINTSVPPSGTLIRSFEPGEDWFWDYASQEFRPGHLLAPPEHHPLGQPIPGTAGRVPADWQSRLH